MTNERDKEGMDQLVSDTYRALSREKAPEALNQSVLKMAAEQSASDDNRHPIFASWMKPVAWTATIGLTLTIALQLTELPIETADPVPAVQSVAEDATSKDTDRPNKPQEGARLRFDSKATGSSDKEAVVTINLNAQKAKRQVDAYATSAPAMATTSAQTPDTPAAAAVLEEAVDAIQACDKTARKSAKSWLACIEELRNAGATELADREYLALKETYPAKTAELEANK